MIINSFLTCLNNFGVSTGASTALEGVYSFNSGTTGVNSLIYNQLYSTGYHFLNGAIYGPSLPLLNITDTPIINNTFSGSNIFHVGYQHTGNFGVILDIQYSGCTKRSSYQNKDFVLVSTAASQNDFPSGFIVGINDANRLFFRTNNLAYTLGKELTTHDFVYVGLTQNRYVNVSIFNYDDNLVYSEEITMPSGVLNTPNLYIGGLLNNLDSGHYNNYVGIVNSVILFNDALTSTDVQTCSTCGITTGYAISSGTVNLSGIQITGSYFSGIQTFTTTGYFETTGLVAKTNGSNVSVVFPSGISGYVTTGEVALPLYSNIAFQINRNAYNFLFDQNVLNTFATYNLNFDISLNSGDVVEVYTYPQNNPNVGIDVTGLQWPISTGFVQLVGNGLAETNGVDYNVVKNQISGFASGDILSFDILSASTITMPYSGYWYGSRILLSGGSYYPSNSQFFEDPTNPNLSGQILITGLSGISTGNPYYPTFGYDLYINGQKLVSGLQYKVASSGTNGFVVYLSGQNLPSFTADGLYSPTGGLPTGVTNVDSSELIFMPQFSGFQRFYFSISGNENVMSGITGFSEQVWVNGIRQLYNFDYFKIRPCSFVTGQINAPQLNNIFYNSQNDTIGLWNFKFPPTIQGLNLQGEGVSPLSYNLEWTPPTLGNYASGNFLEVWFSLNSGAFYLLDTVNTTGISFKMYNISGTNVGCGQFAMRYRNQNIIGPFSLTDIICNN